MSKYDFELDMKTQNSNSVILKGIKPETTVLEVGCAHGRMTKYLKETLKCTIDIIEIDTEAGRVAKQWARNAFIGEPNTGNSGNIEDPWMFPRIKEFWDTEYDYIIFADVLEHLHEPAEVLESAKEVLKKEGSIWISIPNVAYNGIIIDLINDQFTYRETGLMDSTHLRWFTMKSLEKMVTKCGYKIATEHNLINFVRFSEFKDAYSKVPPQIASFLKFRPGGEVYQMVWELKINE